MAAWSNYFSVLAEVAATLTGLVFVAVSINLTSVLSTPGLPGRAGESLMQLLGVVAISTTALVPQQAAGALGVEILAIAGLLWTLQTGIQVRYLTKKTGHPRYWGVMRVIKTQFANVPFFVAGVLLLRGATDGLYWLAPGFLFSLVAGVVNAWILLVEILR